jgi:hypothetical protein
MATQVRALRIILTGRALWRFTAWMVAQLQHRWLMFQKLWLDRGDACEKANNYLTRTPVNQYYRRVVTFKNNSGIRHE